jgi:hypothetical protein
LIPVTGIIVSSDSAGSKGIQSGNKIINSTRDLTSNKDHLNSASSLSKTSLDVQETPLCEA